MRRKMLALLCSLPGLAWTQVSFPDLPQPVATYAFEDKDWQVETTDKPKRGPAHAPTPTSIPGARVINTQTLKALLKTNKTVLVVDVLSSKARKSIPGAVWMPGAGDGAFYGAEKARFSTAIDKLTSGDKTRPVVFLCVSSECWQSYNAALHALEAGYTDVIWYRGGTAAWRGANLDWTEPEQITW